MLAKVVAIGIYIVHGIVAWPETTAMMAVLRGGFFGGRSMRFLPAQLIRALVVGMGAILTVAFGWRYWMASAAHIRKRPDPALRQRLIHLPLGPARESLKRHLSLGGLLSCLTSLK